MQIIAFYAQKYLYLHDKRNKCMDKRVLENVLTDQRIELQRSSRKPICTRREEEMVDLNSPQAQVVIGIRRSGKSTLCLNVLRRSGVHFAYVNFDDERFLDLKGADLNDVLEVLYKIYGDFEHLFIDEIQNIAEWYLFVNRLLRQGMHVLITGSNAKLLSGELATHLTGRHHAIALYPFSFAEYCHYMGVDTASNSTRAIAARRAAFDSYMQQGGFPEIYATSNPHDYIAGLVNDILQRDIEQRFRIQHITAFEQLSQHLLNVAPAIVADNRLKDLFGIKSEHTIKNYITYLKQAYLLEVLLRYSPKSRLRLTGGKVYPVDVALMDNRSDAFAGENMGWRLETIVAIALIRRARQQHLDVYYYSERTSECDFVVCRNRTVVQAIQVSYDIQKPKTLKRELRGLVTVAHKTRCENLLLLTDSHHENLEMEGFRIAIRPAHEWLTGDE